MISNSVYTNLRGRLKNAFQLCLPFPKVSIWCQNENRRKNNRIQLEEVSLRGEQSHEQFRNKNKFEQFPLVIWLRKLNLHKQCFNSVLIHILESILHVIKRKYRKILILPASRLLCSHIPRKRVTCHHNC